MHARGTCSSRDTLQTSCDRKMSTSVNVQAVQAISTALAAALLPLLQPTQQATQQLTQQLTQQPTQQLAQQPTQQPSTSTTGQPSRTQSSSSARSASNSFWLVILTATANYCGIFAFRFVLLYYTAHQHYFMLSLLWAWQLNLWTSAHVVTFDSSHYRDNDFLGCRQTTSGCTCRRHFTVETIELLMD